MRFMVIIMDGKRGVVNGEAGGPVGGTSNFERRTSNVQRRKLKLQMRAGCPRSRVWLIFLLGYVGPLGRNLFGETDE